MCPCARFVFSRLDCSSCRRYSARLHRSLRAGLPDALGPVLFVIGFAPILPNIVLFCLNVKHFALTTSIEQLKDDKLATTIERHIKACSPPPVLYQYLAPTVDHAR